MKAIIKKELRIYFSTPIAYVFMSVFVCVSALLFTIYNLLNANASISVIFSYLPFIFVVMIPILTMRLMAEERSLKTDQLLLTAPVSVMSIVCGKFLAALAILGISIVFMIMFPVILSVYSSIEWGIVVSNYIGFFLMGAAFIALGIYVSSLTENQLVSAIVSIAALILSFILSYGIDSTGIKLVDVILDAFSIPGHFDTFFIGLVDIAEVVYYLSVVAVFILLTVMRTEKRRISK